MIVLAPSYIQEAFDFTFLAFDLADKYRMPVMILGDGMLGQMMEPLEAKSEKRKAKNLEKSWALTGCKGREPNIIKSFYMKEGDLEKFNLKLQEKYKKIESKEARWEEYKLDDVDIILVAYGTMARIAKDAVNQLRENKIKAGLIRPITLWPFPKNIFSLLSARYSLLKFLVIEMSYGQMVEDVRLSIDGKARVEFLGRSGGGIPTQEQIIDKVKTVIATPEVAVG